MADTVLCDNCGAPMSPQDGFCGECGAPRPTLTAGTPPAEPETSLDPEVLQSTSPLPSPPALPKGPSQGWRTASTVIAIVAAVAALGMCGLGAVVSLIPVEGYSRQEMLLASTVACFCPGTLALVLAAILWFLVVRRK
ncbi:MAG TPA: hypothetical protein PKO09_13690 [Anaerolineae bacterium]|nr:hypothetical protein [Anaerolineae bacterium]